MTKRWKIIFFLKYKQHHSHVGGASFRPATFKARASHIMHRFLLRLCSNHRKRQNGKRLSAGRWMWYSAYLSQDLPSESRLGVGEPGSLLPEGHGLLAAAAAPWLRADLSPRRAACVRHFCSRHSSGCTHAYLPAGTENIDFLLLNLPLPRLLLAGWRIKGRY